MFFVSLFTVNNYENIAMNRCIIKKVFSTTFFET